MILSLLLSPALAADVARVPQDHPTLQHAVDHSTAPVVRVAAGHHEGAVLHRPVHLIGEGAVLSGGVRSAGQHAALVLSEAASGSVIEGFTVDCASSSRLDLGVITSSRRSGSVASDVVIRDNTFLGCTQGVTNAGPAAEACTDPPRGGAWWEIADNTFHGLPSHSDRGHVGGGVGVVLYNAVGADVHGNTFSGTVDDRRDLSTAGISLAGCVDCTIAANRFTVDGGRHFYAAVSNDGARLPGAVASRNLLLVDNDATAEDHPWLDVAFRSRASVNTTLDANLGVAYVDHEVCGDGALYADRPMPR